MDLTEAKKLGAQALFGEKYSDEVRVVSIGYKEEANLKNRKKIRYSMELCGGTHVGRTGMIGSFVIRSEVSSSSGVRRIEALTGLNALRYIQVNRKSIYDLATLLKTPVSKVADRVKALSVEKRYLQEQLARLKSSSGSASTLKQADKRTKEIHGVKLIINILDAFQIREMRALTDEQKNLSNSAVIVNLSKDGDKVSYTVGVTPNLCEMISAVDIIKEISDLTNGKGGGRSDFAQGGGLGSEKVDQIVERVEKFLSHAIL